MSLITAAATLLASIPFLYLLAIKSRNSQSFLYSLSGVSLSFFLFSYHVHEKTILLPILPISLLTIFNHPEIFQFSIILSMFSMYPMLILDGIRIPYFLMQILFFTLSNAHIENISYFSYTYNMK